MAVRVIGGEAKGRRLAAPGGKATRPTSDFVREALFNTLQALVHWPGAAVVDLFAGSGALGIEALSRGAASCVFVESDRRAVGVLRANLDAAGVASRSHVVVRDAAAWASTEAGHFDLALADPPYAFDRWHMIGSIHASLLVAESDREVDPGPGWVILRTKRYSGTVVTLFEPKE